MLKSAFTLLTCSIILYSSQASAKSLVDYFKDSNKLYISEREQKSLEQLQRLNQQVKQELAQGDKVSPVINRISQGSIERDVLANFLAIMNLRKSHNDQIQKRLSQKTYKDDLERKRWQAAYQPLRLDLVSEDLRRLVYLHPIIMPLANYVQPGSIRVADIDRGWLENERNFKYCFFYLYRKFASMEKTQRGYSAMCGKIGLSDAGGGANLSSFFNRDLDFSFFARKFDTGIHNKESKFFTFDGYIYKYLKNEPLDEAARSPLIKTFRTYCIYREYCRDCNLVEFYNQRKLNTFYDITLEMEQALAYDVSSLDDYMRLLYYLGRTFPNLSAFLLIQKDGKYKFTDHKEKSPVLERLKSVWGAIPARNSDPVMAVNGLKFTLGTACLLPQKEVSVANEDYVFDRSGYATYIQEYISIYNKYQPPK